MKSLTAPGEPQIRPSALRQRGKKTPSGQMVNQMAFWALVHDYRNARCSYCEIGLASPSDRSAPEGERPTMILRDPGQKEITEGWLMACPCCAIEHDARYRMEALKNGKAAVFAWTDPVDHPSQREITATVRAMTGILDHIAAQYPDHQLNLRQWIFESFRKEGYGVNGVWDAPEEFLITLRSLVHARDLPLIPPPGSRYTPGVTRGSTATWVSEAWARILDTDPGFWARSSRHLLILPWPEIARNRSCDYREAIESAQKAIEGSEQRYSIAKARFGTEPSIMAQRLKSSF